MSGLSPLGALVRRVDPDRFLCTLFAPPERRETLFALYAFNHELARAWDVASVAPLALIRLQWWREVVEGASRSHEVATPLAAEIAAGRLDRATLLALIDARESEAEFETTAAWRDHALAGAGGLAVAAGHALGSGPDRLRKLGAAYGVAGALRNVAALTRRGRCLLPHDLLAVHGLGPDTVIARPDDPHLAPVMAALAGWGRQLAGGPQPLQRHVVAAGLVGVLGRRDLRRPGQAGRGVTDRLAVTWAALTGWL